MWFRLSSLGLLLGLATSVACFGAGSFECSSNNECFFGGEFGSCVEPGFCAFPDETCESGLVYGQHSGSLGGVCVPEDAEELETGDGDGDGDAEGESETSGSESGTGTGTGTDTDSDETGIEPDCASDEDCGECARCNGQGQCDAGLADGDECDSGMPIKCSDYIWGEAEDMWEWSCFARPDVTVTGSCQAGSCQAPTTLDCPNEQGAALVTCDDRCIRPNNPCTPGALSSQISLQSFCYLNQTTDTCKSFCNNGTESQVTHRVCNAGGDCQAQSFEGCGPYLCNGDMCGTSCQQNSDCNSFWFVNCVDNMCQ